MDVVVLKVLDWVFMGAATIATIMSGIVGYFVNSAHNKLERQETALDVLREQHNNFRVEVSNTYVKAHTLEAITNRMDATLDEIRNDIKILLQRK